MMAQWQACKDEAKGAILFFRLGDFYEAFHDDALLVARELDITLTKRQETPMSGVPFHASEGYIDKLVSKGYRVAIAEQTEDAKLAKGLVKREIVRIVTPGTVMSQALLSDKNNNFLACITQVNTSFGLSVLDLTTAEFRAMELESEKELEGELFRLQPKEILVSAKWHKNHSAEAFPFVLTTKEDWHFDHKMACESLLKHFKVHNLDGFGLKGMVAAVNAAGALLSYVSEDLNLSIAHVQKIQTEKLSAYMALDRATQRHLELTESLQSEKKKHTLLHLLDETATPMGGRLLRQWLTHPLLSVEGIRERQDAIEQLLNRNISALQNIRDLERLIMRIETGYATPRDLVALRYSLEPIPALHAVLGDLSSTLIARALQKCTDVSSITALIASALVEAPPLRLSDGGIFKTGYHPELDELHAIRADSHTWIAKYQTELREETRIKTLKVSFTQAFGYYIEVSRGQAEKMPDRFQRRQTLVNAERFITPELKDYEHRALTAEDRQLALETQLFHELRAKIAAHAPEIRVIAQAIAQIDCLSALAKVAKEHCYVRPLVDESSLFHIEEGRHPVIEASLSKESFIPNDVHLDQKEERLLLITGPNMAGKSTYIRQVALIAIMAQMGSFVPAKSAHIGIIDKVFSRIGASDDLTRGQSTFMVEMTETANILHNATERSLVILDEIGRGTSTYDGISIAWAVAEHLLKVAKTLFATHYWELTQMEGKIPGAVNYNVAVHESPDGIVFLRKIVRGGTDKSYGIHVARLAGLPPSVIKRAQEMLAKLEKQPGRAPPPAAKQEQLSFFL
jgi:DNA mismatch repair protein MutS